MSKVGIIGIGHGVFGRRSDATVQELAFEAFKAAMEDAGIGRDDLDASVIGSVPEYHKQRSLPGVVNDRLRLQGRVVSRTSWVDPVRLVERVHEIVNFLRLRKTRRSVVQVDDVFHHGSSHVESVNGTKTADNRKESQKR